ncbi:ribose-phosphate diphosphokinase [Primorskyibacter aestuariivivens]|nr:ribose-phosphate diphosphokinase [Primorskyibacter aestuariivivens]MDA7429212.1 ribose-phosphate diphosphokinase [Primorskyibacter aestuariivivens]
MTPFFLAFPGIEPLSHRIADLMDGEAQTVGLHQFPDGETLVTLPQGIDGRAVSVVANLRDPDQVALPLRFTAETARDLGASSVGLVAPYLSYMRQDRRFAPGQAISAPIFARFLEQSFDWLVTVDPHLHRISALEEVFRFSALRVASAPLIADWIVTNVPDAVILGPDSESQQWVADVAALADKPYEVLTKVRSGDRTVEISVPQSTALTQGTPVVLDDIASSGRTMTQAIDLLRAAGTKPPVCIIIHAVFADNAYHDILAAGAERVITTDTIPHSSNAIGLAPLLAPAVQSAAQDTSRIPETPMEAQR